MKARRWSEEQFQRLWTALEHNWVLMERGEYREAAATIEQVVAEWVGQEVDEVLLMEAHMAIAVSYLFAGDCVQAISHFQAVSDSARPRDRKTVKRWTTNKLAHILDWIDTPGARAHVERVCAALGIDETELDGRRGWTE